MKRKEILEELKIMDTHGIPREEYSIVYGAALVMNGVRDETSDLDVSINISVKTKLETFGYKFKEFNNGKKKGWKLSLSPNLDLHTHDTLMSPIIAEVIDGYYVQTIDSVIIEKFLRGRGKDLKDVQNILEKMPNKHMLN